LEIEGHPKITRKELEALRKEFRGEMVSSDTSYNALAKELGVTYSQAKPALPEFKFTSRVNESICALFQEDNDSWGCYVVSKDPEQCSISDTNLRSKLRFALNAEVRQRVTDYPEWERPKDLKQFSLATVASFVSSLFSLVASVSSGFWWIAPVLCVCIIIPTVYYLGDWSLKR